MTDTFCPLPWNFQAIRNNGDVRICCQANITENRGVVRHEDGRSFNAANDDLAAARNAPLMKAVRRNMLEGVWSDECARCRIEEESGLASRRQYEIKNWSLTPDEARASTQADGSIDDRAFPIEYLDIRFGNFCNLACVMCGPEDSHSWYDDYVALTGEEFFVDTHTRVDLKKNAKGKYITDAYGWYEKDSFYDRLGDLSNLKHIYSAGGEPLLIAKHYEFLEHLVGLGYAQNIVLEYNTNCTSISKRAIDLWSRFKAVRIGASIDGVGDVYEYIRYPGRWQAVVENLDKLAAIPNCRFWFATTVSNLNVLHVPDLLRWCLAQSYPNFRKLPSFHVAYGPKTVSPRIIPLWFKDIVSERYRAAGTEFGDAAILTKLEGLLSYINSVDQSADLPTFRHYVKTLETRRRNSIVSIYPEYERIFSGA